MKTGSFALSMALLIMATMATLALPGLPAWNAQERQTLTITASLQGANGSESGDLVTTLKAGKVFAVSLKKGRRYRGFAIIDRTRASEVACEAKDAEYGAVRTKAGFWIAVVMCPESSGASAIRVPSLIRARASANEATAEMECWENKDLRMGICFKVGTNPDNKPMPQTREHILLARQVGVP